MEQLNNLDVVFLIITGVSALVGVARGMTKELLSLAGWILAAAAVFYITPLLEPVMQKYIASKILASVVSGMIVLIVFCVVWILTVDKIASVIRSSKLSALDRVLGFVFGTARGIVIVILIAMMLTTLIPEESKKGVFAESKYFNEAAQCAEPLMAMIPQSWIDQFKAKSESLGFGSAEDKEKAKEADKESKDNTDVKEKADSEETQKTKESEVKADENAETEKTVNSEEKAAKEESKESKPEILIKLPLDLIDRNMDMLQKSGEELFNQLAQPKTSGQEDGGESALESMSSDLDKLLDVLEDRVIITDEATPEMKSETQKVEEKIKEKIDADN
ncbi:MAG: CvpA family protein [Alphaproteobacteria bacterium]|nr:CvpA family protein [Alphaproteobacteria bacterium]